MRHYKRKDILISILIISVTLLYFKVSFFIPEGLDTINFLGVEIGSFGFQDFTVLINFIKMKILIISYSVIWFFTCKNWWRYSILVVIVVELFKLMNALNSDKYHIDDVTDFIMSLPFTLPVIILLLLLSHKLNSYNLSKELRNNIDDKIDQVFFELNKKQKEKINKLDLKFQDIKKNKKQTSSEDYINSLIKIRNEFYEF